MPVSIIKLIQTGIQSGAANILPDADNASAMRRKTNTSSHLATMNSEKSRANHTVFVSLQRGEQVLRVSISSGKSKFVNC